MNFSLTFVFFVVFVTAPVTSSKKFRLSDFYLDPRPMPSEKATVDCSAIPPLYFCSNEQIIKDCGFESACSRYNSTYGKKTKITLFLEAYCPDCQRYVTGPLKESYVTFKDFVDFEIVPFGNAKIVDDEIECQHGPKECAANKLESCIIKYVVEPIPFVICLEERLSKGLTQNSAFTKCAYILKLETHHVDQILHCNNTGVGDDLQRAAATRTAAVYPEQHEFVPWILVNNISVSNFQYTLSDFAYTLCNVINPPLPRICGGLAADRNVDSIMPQNKPCYRN